MMKPYQMKLPFPRGKRYPMECGHPDQKNAGWGMCVACYHRRYREQHHERRLEIERASRARKKERQKGERRTLVRRMADFVQAGVLRGEIPVYMGEVVELDERTV